MNVKRTILCVIVLALIACLIVVMTIRKDRIIATIEEPVNISVSASAGNQIWNQVGRIVFRITAGWKKEEIKLHDDGFDGTLDRVIYYENKERHELEPNAPDWDIWVKRYVEVRTEATKG